MSVAQQHEDAAVLWRLADKARDEAKSCKRRAHELEQEAERLDRLAAALADGRSLTEALR